MKKLISMLLVLALVVAIAMPVMALGSSMTYRTVNGTVTPSNGKTYTISTKTGASITKATGTMSCDMNANLSVTLKAVIHNMNGTYVRTDTFGNVETGKTVSVGAGESTPEKFYSVEGSYFVNGVLGVRYSVT